MISVIVPCYNCCTTVERCLESILRQTFENLEVIAVDDGSQDNTLAVLEKIQKKDSRLSILRQSNEGPSSARNHGMKHAKGEFIAFVDSDDWVDENIYSKMLESARENSSDMVICNYAYIYPDGESHECLHMLSSMYCGHKDIVQGVIRRFYNGDPTGLASPFNKLYRREFLEKHGLRFDSAYYKGEDWWFNLKCFEQADRISTLPDVLYFYWQGSTDNLMKKMELRLYEEWKYSKQYLIEKNKEYGFSIDNHLQYRDMLFNVHSLLLALRNDSEAMDKILRDEFYNEIIHYDHYVTIPVKFVHIVHRVSVQLEKVMYKAMGKALEIKGEL